MKSLVRIAEQISTYPHSYMNNKHISVAVMGKHVSFIKVNQYDKRIGNIENTLHAEIASLTALKKRLAIKKPRWNEKMSKVIIIVIRINSSGELMNSSPCVDCVNSLRAIGVKGVLFSTGCKYMPFVYKKMSDTFHKHISYSRRQLNAIS